MYSDTPKAGEERNRLGHKQVSTTQNIYAHMMKESDRKASDAIANALYKDIA